MEKRQTRTTRYKTGQDRDRLCPRLARFAFSSFTNTHDRAPLPRLCAACARHITEGDTMTDLLHPDGPDLSPTVRAMLEDSACSQCGRPGDQFTLLLGVVARNAHGRPTVWRVGCAEDCAVPLGEAAY
jgi:hypothetical protein